MSEDTGPLGDEPGIDQREEMEMDKQKSSYETLAAINVNEHIEKKGKFSYLSWTWAVDTLMRADPTANWTYGDPVTFGETMMVSCTVTAFGVARTMHLPVMTDANKAMPNPDSFAINKAMQRCLVKAIALHGLGLYIYAGEDLPADEVAKREEEAAALTKAEEKTLTDLGDAAAEGMEALKAAWKKLPAKTRDRLTDKLDGLKALAAKNEKKEPAEAAA